MGVDISLHIEIRKQNQWHLMTVTSPQWEKTDPNMRFLILRSLTAGITTFGTS